MTTRASDHLTAAVDSALVGLVSLVFFELTPAAAVTTALAVYLGLVGLFTVHRRHGLRLQAARPALAQVVPVAARPTRVASTLRPLPTLTSHETRS